jgi:hypothetical protein
VPHHVNAAVNRLQMIEGVRLKNYPCPPAAKRRYLINLAPRCRENMIGIIQKLRHISRENVSRNSHIDHRQLLQDFAAKILSKDFRTPATFTLTSIAGLFKIAWPQVAPAAIHSGPMGFC